MKRIVMIVENMYPRDPRVRKEANTLAGQGYDVSVIALRGCGEPRRETVDGVHVLRVPNAKKLFRKSVSKDDIDSRKIVALAGTIFGYLLEHVYFTLISFFLSLWVWAKYGLDIIHLHNPPDTLVFIGAFYKLFGKKYVFDHHDLSPELYRVRCRGKNGFIDTMLMFMEKLSCTIADCVITTNESYKQIEVRRHKINSNKITVVRNDPVMDEINGGHLKRNASGNDKPALLFLGTINPQDGVNTLLMALHILIYQMKANNFTCNILGDGDCLKESISVAKKLQLSSYVDFKGYVSDREMVRQFLCNADIGVEPAPVNELNWNSTFIKVTEYMAAGKPVVAFDLKETRYSVDRGGVLVPVNSPMDFAAAIKTTLDDSKLRKRLGKIGQARVKKQLNWTAASSNLIKAYSRLYNENLQL